MEKNTVYCQIRKQWITAAICSMLQGVPDCAGCAAPTRQCEHCKKRIVEFPDTGLCRECSQKDPEQHNASLAHSIPSRSMRWTLWHVQEDQPNFQELLAQAETLVRKEGKASARLLCQKFNVTHSIAKRLIQALETSSIIGPPYARRPRRVLSVRSSVDVPSQNQPENESTDKPVLPVGETVSSVSSDTVLETQVFSLTLPSYLCHDVSGESTHDSAAVGWSLKMELLVRILQVLPSQSQASKIIRTIMDDVRIIHAIQHLFIPADH